MDLEHAKERITEEQARVQGLVDEMRGELGQSDDAASAELSDYDQHPADSGSEVFEREKDFSILEELEAELAELEAALRRIDDGTYGIDEVTGATIDPERLDAVPAAHQRRHRRPRPPFGLGACRPFGHGAAWPFGHRAGRPLAVGADLTVRLRMFAQAREAAGRAEDAFDAAHLGELLDAARARYGAEFAAVLTRARVWVNGDEPADGDATELRDGDEVAVLPPVSGG